MQLKLWYKQLHYQWKVDLEEGINQSSAINLKYKILPYAHGNSPTGQSLKAKSIKSILKKTGPNSKNHSERKSRIEKQRDIVKGSAKVTNFIKIFLHKDLRESSTMRLWPNPRTHRENSDNRQRFCASKYTKHPSHKWWENKKKQSCESYFLTKLVSLWTGVFFFLLFFFWTQVPGEGKY